MPHGGTSTLLQRIEENFHVVVTEPQINNWLPRNHGKAKRGCKALLTKSEKETLCELRNGFCDGSWLDIH